MITNYAWLGATAVGVTLATLGAVGLLSHIDEGRSASVLVFDILWITAALLLARTTWRRTRWGSPT